MLADVLWADLDFEREFYMISRKSSAGDSGRRDAADAAVRSQWTEIGADFVLMGSRARGRAATLTVEVRLIGVRGDNAGPQAFGQTYDGCAIDERRASARTRSPTTCTRSCATSTASRARSIAFTSDRDAERDDGPPVQNSGQAKRSTSWTTTAQNETPITVNKSLNIGPSWGPTGGRSRTRPTPSQYPDIYVATLDGRPPDPPAEGTEIVQNQAPGHLAGRQPDRVRRRAAAARVPRTSGWSIGMDRI